VILVLAVVIARVYSARHVVALVAGSVRNLVSIIARLPASALRVNLRHSIQIGLGQIILRVVVLIVPALDQLLLGLFQA
jgi:hypothetical protein